jgi:hypothetical protein
LVTKSDGADGPCRISVLTGFAAGCICAQKAAGGFFQDIHGYAVLVLQDRKYLIDMQIHVIGPDKWHNVPK